VNGVVAQWTKVFGLAIELDVGMFTPLQAARLGHVTSTLVGVAKCPYSPRHNATYIMTSDGNFYTATVTDLTARDAAIYRMMGDAKYLRTAQYNSRWLNGTNRRETDFDSAAPDTLTLGSRRVSVLDSGALRPGFKSQPRRCRLTVLGKLFTPVVPLFTKQQNW